ncbi:hypothetical protein CA54_40750 [Symmachiella macrocystis]|uniref:SF3 helicase domain-containing protein n=1 Tax=Symmachiella macrocystis TaxID=2527985 RepID=A0A5C6BA51_9PLAN|nr:phage/plasmid primase, P4 family [Symmachiella macrocystis]TWU08838.1 hypothetical protein CA54_40750 [Symmachiella macrocystis]
MALSPINVNAERTAANLGNCPIPFSKLSTWMLWKVQRAKNKKGWTKQPWSITANHAVDRKAEPMTLSEAFSLAAKRDDIGVGCVLPPDMFFIDLDGVRNPVTGLLSGDAQEIVDQFAAVGCYIQVTPSGMGLHIWGVGKADPAYNGKKLPDGESQFFCGDSPNFATFTGNLHPQSSDEIGDCSNLLASWLPSTFPGVSLDRKVHSTATETLEGFELDEMRERVAYVLNKLPIEDFRERDVWRNIVWAIQASGLPDEMAREFAEDWSQGDVESFDVREFDKVWASDKPDRPDRITVGTLWHWDEKYDTPQEKRQKENFKRSIQKMAAKHEAEEAKGIRGYRNNLTDFGNAEFFAESHSDRVMYVVGQNKRYTWNGVSWELDDARKAYVLAAATAREIVRRGMEVKNEDRRKAVIAHGIRSESASRINAMLECSIPLTAKGVSDLNDDEGLLNLNNGVLNLRNGILLPHDPDLRITKHCKIAYEPEASQADWLTFLHQIFEQETEAKTRELVRYVQALVGYAAMGDCREELFVILNGGGRNGKSTFLNVLQNVLCEDYCITFDKELLSATGREHSTGRMDVYSKRLAYVQETNERMRLNPAMVKQLTGRDVIRGRKLYQDNWQFSPTHTLFLSTNQLPEYDTNDRALQRRLRVVPFRQEFWKQGEIGMPEDAKQADTKLEDRLLAQKAGVLNWIVEGSMRYEVEGLQTPSVVEIATADYAEKASSTRPFFDAHVAIDADRVGATLLYQTYVRFQKSQGEAYVTIRQFTAEVKAAFRGVEHKQGNKGRKVWVGIKLVDLPTVFSDDEAQPGDVI